MKTLPIDMENLHHATQDKIDRLSENGFSLNRYKREYSVKDKISIDGCTVSDLLRICEREKIDIHEAIIAPEEYIMEYGPPVLNYTRLETDQEAAQRAIKNWEEKQEKKKEKKQQEKDEKELLRKLAEKYPNEI